MEKRIHPFRRKPTADQHIRLTALKRPPNRRHQQPRRQKETKKARRMTGSIQVNISIWVMAGILAAIGTLLIIPYIKDGASPQTGDPLPQGPYCYGIDVSRYQHKIKWDSLMVLTDRSGRTIYSKTSAKDIRPVSFVFIKATEGSSMKDKRFHRHWQDAGKSGARRGAYHFFRSSKDPVHQAENFIEDSRRNLSGGPAACS